MPQKEIGSSGKRLFNFIIGGEYVRDKAKSVLLLKKSTFFIKNMVTSLLAGVLIVLSLAKYPCLTLSPIYSLITYRWELPL